MSRAKYAKGDEVIVTDPHGRPDRPARITTIQPYLGNGYRVAFTDRLPYHATTAWVPETAISARGKDGNNVP